MLSPSWQEAWGQACTLGGGESCPSSGGSSLAAVWRLGLALSPRGAGRAPGEASFQPQGDRASPKSQGVGGVVLALGKAPFQPHGDQGQPRALRGRGSCPGSGDTSLQSLGDRGSPEPQGVGELFRLWGQLLSSCKELEQLPSPSRAQGQPQSPCGWEGAAPRVGTALPTSLPGLRV